jgi:peroxiredoxin Q/BCP
MGKKISLLLLLPFCIALFGIAAGTKAPDFSAKNQEGKTVRLSALHGKYVLLYFYPKDDTPGCTKEACDFRDHYAKLRAMNTVILGVSRQGAKSHQAFIQKHHLPFDLLVDESGAIAKRFGVGEIASKGLHQRQSVLIGPDGKVLKFYAHVDPATHVGEVLADLKAAKK